MEVIEIKNHRNEAVLYSGKHADAKEAVEAAVKARANLTGAAPKLLEALEAMVEMYGPRGGEVVFDGPVYDAVAAIVETKGE